jgi:hypothetical protein
LRARQFSRYYRIGGIAEVKKRALRNNAAELEQNGTADVAIAGKGLMAEII